MNNLFDPSTADYAHIAHDATCTVELTAEEVASVFAAHDFGTVPLHEKQRELLHSVIAKLKDQLHR